MGCSGTMASQGGRQKRLSGPTGAVHSFGMAKRDAKRDAVLEEIQSQDPRYKQKHDDAVSLIALVKLQRMSRPAAWRKLFPQDAEKSDNALALRAGRLERWHRNHFPSNLFEMLSRNHLGIPRVAQEVQRMLKATRYDPNSKQREPDWKTVTEGVKILCQLWGITSTGNHLDDLRHAARQYIGQPAKDAPKTIDVGPPPKDLRGVHADGARRAEAGRGTLLATPARCDSNLVGITTTRSRRRRRSTTICRSTNSN